MSVLIGRRVLVFQRIVRHALGPQSTAQHAALPFTTSRRLALSSTARSRQSLRVERFPAQQHSLRPAAPLTTAFAPLSKAFPPASHPLAVPNTPIAIMSHQEHDDDFFGPSTTGRSSDDYSPDAPSVPFNGDLGLIIPIFEPTPAHEPSPLPAGYPFGAPMQEGDGDDALTRIQHSSIICSSTLKKRRRKMKRHKHRKWLKKMKSHWQRIGKK